MITCLAVTAAIRPKSLGVSSHSRMTCSSSSSSWANTVTSPLSRAATTPAPPGGVGLALVGGGEGALERADARLERDALLALEEAQLIDRDLHVAVLSLPVILGRGRLRVTTATPPSRGPPRTAAP